jgi:PBSX family phage terminase large subunit
MASPAAILTKKQLEALVLIKNRKKTAVLLYGGARSGKSFLNCYYVCAKSMLYPHSRHLLLRQIFNDARRSVWEQTLLPMLSSYFADSYEINKTDCVVRFKNGSEICLGGLESEERVIKVMGREFNTIVFSEMSECSFSTFQKLMTRLSYKIKNSEGKVCHNNFLGDCNPTAPTHWAKNVFIDLKDPQKKTDIENPDEYGYLLMNPEDNRDNLPLKYIERYLDTLTGLEYLRLRMGQWAANTEGLVYDLRPFHLISFPGKIAFYELGIDWGYAHPFGLVVIGKGFKGEMYVVDEEKKTGLQPGQVRELILDKARQYKCELGYCDTTEPGLMLDINDNDIGFTLIGANKDRETGITRVRKLMEKGENGTPRLFIVEKKCPKLIEEFYSHSYKKIAEGLYSDKDVIKQNDDLLDPLRYWANSSPDQSIDEWMEEYDRQVAV